MPCPLHPTTPHCSTKVHIRLTSDRVKYPLGKRPRFVERESPLDAGKKMDLTD